MLFSQIVRLVIIATIVLTLPVLTAAEKLDPATDHFWYRTPPTGPYIDSQRDHKAFGFSDAAVFLSEDNGRTWPHKVAFPGADNITFSCILKNGNILFATRAKLYLSTDNLKTYKPITVKDADGADYSSHTPQDANHPGWYFHPLDGVHTWDVNGVEMLVWGNYCNVLGGATPVNIYYSTDGGHTVKIAYAFGQNPGYRDNGSAGGGSTGALLGDPDNPVICRHIHCVAYNPSENAFYACTGDGDREEKHECHWLKGTYDAEQDKWRWTVLVSAASNSRYKSGGINFVDGKLYWVADANGPKPHDRGIFRCDPADLANPERHTMLFNPQYESANMIIQDGTILASHYAPASPYATGFIVSPDMGRTWAQYDLKEFGRRSAVRFHRKNSGGWFRVDLRSGWITRAEVLFIKPKSAAEEPLTLENVRPLEANRPDEPIRNEFSIDAAVRFLDAVALNWQKERTCFACHSDYAFFFTRPVVSWKAPAHRQLRSKLEHLAEHPRDVEYRATEAVMVASMLAQNDALTTGKLHPTTRKALGRMWTMQREDGGFDWMKYNQPPSEIDDHYGVTMAAIGVGAAPDDYAETPAAKAGLDKIRAYFANNPPAHLHHRAMKLLASLHVGGIMTEPERQQVVEDLFALQKSDGAWGAVTLGNWARSDDKPRDMQSSDGYGTGFSIYVLRQAGVPADHPRIQKGIAWLKTHQRASGRWFTRSMWKDSKHYITHTGTAYCILALAACGEITPAAVGNGKILTIDFAAEGGPVSPRNGFLGGLRDSTPDEILRPMNISLWRIGHQFRGRIGEGLPTAIDRVESLGGVYKLVMSDLIHSQPTDWAVYEADVKKLVRQVGARSGTIIWEPVNEPDISHKPIEKYYELYAHALKALREADPKTQICGPGFAFPAYDKYRPFLDYCRKNNLECNYLAWHYTGWDADAPEQAKWQLGKMREFISEYPGQKIKEIHCDEWGAGPAKPGCLHPGRAIVWFHYLENVYKVDRACRANWGKTDDYLGGIVTSDHQPHPVYHVYRWYGETKGQTRVTVEGCDKALAALASKSPGRAEILLGSILPGSIEKNSQRITLQLKNMPLANITVRRIPGTDLDGILKEDQIPLVKDYTFERSGNDATLTIENVEENQAWQIILTKHPITKGINDFEVDDETYNQQTFRDGIHVLVSTDHPRSDKNIAWVHRYGKARVFGLQSGHDAKVWTNDDFRRLMAQGIRWASLTEP